MTGHWFWGGPGWGVVGGLVSAAFFALAVVLVASLVRSRPHPGPTARSRAIGILEERYARGEISRDEFLQRRAVLTGSPTRPAGGMEQRDEPPTGGGGGPPSGSSSP